MSRLHLRILVACVWFLAARLPVAADWLYDSSPIYNRGITMGPGMTTHMVAQPVRFDSGVSIVQIGVGVARGQDPNNVGFRMILTEDLSRLFDSPLVDRNLYPAGPIYDFAYVSFSPLALDANRWYYIVLAPGDGEFLGAVAYGSSGFMGLASRDYGQTWEDMPYFGVRVGGSVVPEPAASLAIAGMGRRKRQ